MSAQYIVVLQVVAPNYASIKTSSEVGSLELQNRLILEQHVGETGKYFYVLKLYSDTFSAAMSSTVRLCAELTKQKMRIRVSDAFIK
jgi:hypothetical protein